MLVAKTQARIAAVLISVLPCVATSQQSWLQGLRAEVWESATANTSDSSPPSQSADNPSQDHHHHDDSHVSWFSDDCDDDGLEDWFGETVAWVMLGSVTAPFWAPAGIMGDTYGEAGYFAAYPYQSGHPGQVVKASQIETTGATAFPWMARVRSEFAHDLNDLSTTRLQVLIDTTSRLGVDGTMSYHHESVGAGNDELLTGDLNFVFRFAQSPRAQMRAGAGVNWLSDHTLESGFNFTYGGDFFFPSKPCVLSMETDWGRLGDSAMFHLRATAGVVVQGLEVYAGYDFLEVGSAKTNQIIAGVGIWF